MKTARDANVMFEELAKNNYQPPFKRGDGSKDQNIGKHRYISVIGFYGYIKNIGKYRWIFLQKYRKNKIIQNL